MPLTRFARGPPPVTVLVVDASYIRAATGPGLSAGPAAREVLGEIGGIKGGRDGER